MTDKNVSYEVDIGQGTCTCPAFEASTYCKHQFAVDSYDVEIAHGENSLNALVDRSVEDSDGSDRETDNALNLDEPLPQLETESDDALRDRLRLKFEKMLKGNRSNLRLVERKLSEVQRASADSSSEPDEPRVSSFEPVQPSCSRSKSARVTVHAFRNVGKFTKVKGPGRPKNTKKMPSLYDDDRFCLICGVKNCRKLTCKRRV
jgi:SWIM zinc finger